MPDIHDTFEFIKTSTRAKRQGDEYQGHCPAHDDRTPSLSIGWGRNGAIMLNCHRGCQLVTICRALGVERKDLFPPKAKYSFERAYDYRDEGGALLFQSVRLGLTDPASFPNESRKTFKQRAPDGFGGWVNSLKGVRRVLYRLPELLASPEAAVFVVEGEKDVDRLISCGLVSTCNPMGAGRWLADYCQYLAGREVIIIPDNDEPGRQHAERVREMVSPVARSVRILSLPDLPKGGDVSDWLDSGHDVDELCAMSLAPADEPINPSTNGHKQNGLMSICIAEVMVQEVEWLWEKRIPMRLMTILQGIEGVGKSTLLAAIVAAVTCGKGLPDMNVSTPANVLWLSAEDDLGMMLKPRLLSAGANVSRVFAIGDPFTFNEAGVELLRREALAHTPRMIIVDPLFAYTAGDPCKGSDARSITNDLKKVAEEFQCAMVLVRHVGKSKGFGDPRAAGLYSIEWQAAARSVLLAGCDPDVPAKRALTQTKNNLSEMAESIEYSIRPDPTSPSKARFLWGGPSDLTARRILETIATDDETLARRDAEEFLKLVLATGELPAKDVQAEAKANGISERTLDRAKARLRIKSRKITVKGPWLWSLPDDLNVQ